MENTERVQDADVLQEDLMEETETPKAEAETVPESSPEQLLQDEITKLKGEVLELKDKYLRQVAEFDNYRRRMQKEKVEFMLTAARDTMTALLPVLDDFDRASKNETFTEGVNLIFQKFQKTLQAKGVSEMDTAAGIDFDADRHEAVTEIPAGEALVGKVVDTIEKGYLLNDKIIRYAKVVVGR